MEKNDQTGDKERIADSSRILTYSQAVREALEQSMAKDGSIILIGEGVPDPKGVFGTTLGLLQKFGPDRVMDMPVSENGMTGVCIGAAITGMRPILVHQRVDFSLLSLDQIINNAAKWHYMFGGQKCVPLVIRMIIGQGWGQGAQHSQNLQALFTHVPGLKVVMPTTAYDAKGLLISSIKDNNPVIFLEHRWLHNTSSKVPEEMYEIPIGKGRVVREGQDCTIVASSYMTLEALRAADFLNGKGISAEVIDLRTLKPLDDDLIFASVTKTGRLIVVDSGHYTGGFAGEIIARVSEKLFSKLKTPPSRITLPDFPSPSTPGLTKYYYPRYTDIAIKVMDTLERPEWLDFPEDNSPLDIPDASFTGPF